jgi:hypothetical protein
MAQKLSAGKNPSCSDFIVAAIKMIRYRARGRMKTPGGAPLYKVFKVACEIYSTREVQSGLEKLLRGKKIVLATHCITSTAGSLGGIDQLITSIPKKAPLEKQEWILNFQGAPVERKDDNRRTFRNLMLYVRTDDLPEKIIGLIHGERPVTAEGVLASMRKKKQR